MLTAESEVAKIIGIPEDDMRRLSVSLFGTENLEGLSWEQIDKLTAIYYKQSQEKEKAKSKAREEAEERMDSFESGSCFYHGTCPPN